MSNKKNEIELSALLLIALSISACGGGSSESGGQLNKDLVRCLAITGTLVQNNCTFNVNIRYFTSEVTASSVQETVTLLTPGQTFDVSPFDSRTMSGIPGCQAPLEPSQIFKATRIDCI